MRYNNKKIEENKEVNKMEKIYAIFEGQKILRMSRNKDELVKYRQSFPEEIQRKMILAEKIIAGSKEYQQSHWMFGTDAG